MKTDKRTHFRAAVLESTGKSLVIKNLIFPELNFGQVLVEMMYSSICASQLFEISGGRGPDKFLPHLLGHEGVGTVIEIGPGVTRFKIGDKVVLTWVQQEGIECDSIVHKSVDGDFINAGKVTTFSEFTVVSENRLFKAPIGLKDTLLPLMGCAALTGAGMVMEHHSDEERALVVGGGGVGLFTILALMHKGLKSIHVVEPNDVKRMLISALNEVFITYESLDDSRLKNEVKINGCFGEVFVCTSSIFALQESLSMVAAPGLLVFCTHPNQGESLIINPLDLIKGKVILGSWGGGCKNTLIRQQVVDFCIDRADLIEGFISEPIRFDDINNAVELAKSNRHNRVLIRLKK